MKRFGLLVHIFGASIAVLFVYLLFPHAVGATALPTITISPFLQEVRFSGTESTKDFTVSISNNSSKAQTLKLAVLDFGSLNDSGGIVFSGSNESSLIKKYGLANWLQLSEPELRIESGAKAIITATIINDTTLSPGGHYAAIVASVNSPEEDVEGQIAINQKLSSLILATKVGGEKYDLKLDAIQANVNLRLPSYVNLKFTNPGNVHVVPRGTVKILTPSGRIVSQGVINEESSFVLPERSRQIRVPLHTVGSTGLWPTFYRVEVDYRYDGIDQFAHKTVTIIFVNIKAVLFIVVITLLVIWLIYNKKLLLKITNHTKKATKIITKDDSARASKKTIKIVVK